MTPHSRAALSGLYSNTMDTVQKKPAKLFKGMVYCGVCEGVGNIMFKVRGKHEHRFITIVVVLIQMMKKRKLGNALRLGTASG
jgi:hypothetical protein